MRSEPNAWAAATRALAPLVTVASLFVLGGSVDFADTAAAHSDRAAMDSGGTSTVRYEIDAKLDPRAERIDATATLAIPWEWLRSRAVVDLSLASAGLNGSTPRLSIQDVTSGGASLRTELLRDENILRVHLSDPARDDAGTSLHARYSVSMVDSDAEEMGYHLLASTGHTDAWYPIVIGPSGEGGRFFDFHVSVEYPGDWALLTTGSDLAVGDRYVAGPETVRDTFSADHVEGFTLALGHDFVLQTIERSGVPVTAFSSRELAPVYLDAAERASDAAAWYGRTYGFFPVKHVGIVQGHPQYGGGYPLPNVFMLHRARLTPDFVTWITAHELGHYYWGLYVLDEEGRLEWVNLAMGIWADQLYMAERNGIDLEDQWRSLGSGDWVLDYFRAMAGNHEQALDVDSDVADALPFDYNSLVRHGKGATGLYLQSRLLGRDAFLELQRRVLKEYRYRALPERDLIGMLEEAGAQGAASFFGAWREGDARIGATIASVSGSEVNVVRTGPVPYPIAVEVEDASGHATRFTLPAESEEETFTIDTGRASLVRLDPDGVVPMWNSAHPDMHQLAVLSLYWEDLVELFVPAAFDHLQRHPDAAAVRYRLSRTLYSLHRDGEVVALGPRPLPKVREECLAAVYRARSLARLGRRGEARALLDSVAPAAVEFGLDSLWQTARSEAS